MMCFLLLLLVLLLLLLLMLLLLNNVRTSQTYAKVTGKHDLLRNLYSIRVHSVPSIIVVWYHRLCHTCDIQCSSTT